MTVIFCGILTDVVQFPLTASSEGEGFEDGPGIWKACL